MKFGVVGTLGFVVQLGVQNALHSGLGAGYLTALVAAYIVATAVTFVGNRYWAFKHRQGKGLRHESMLFVVLNTVALGVQFAVVGLVVYGLGFKDNFSYNIATIFGIGIGTLFRLWSYRRFVLLALPADPPAAEQLQPQASGRF
jgi:putative flippase GtrA